MLFILLNTTVQTHTYQHTELIKSDVDLDNYTFIHVYFRGKLDYDYLGHHIGDKVLWSNYMAIPTASLAKYMFIPEVTKSYGQYTKTLIVRHGISGQESPVLRHE